MNMTTANREKVHACDYCGSDYTDAKYCCAARREYLNAHGEFETGRAPAASVGDAPSDAVAWELSYPREMPAYELVGAPEFVRSEAHAEKIAAGCESHYGKRATYRALSYTTPPAAPVVSEGLIESARMALEIFDRVLPTFNWSADDLDHLSRDHLDLLNMTPDALRLALRDHDRSVPATDDKGGETYTLAMIEEAWGDSVPLVRSRFNAFRVRLEELRRYAAPTSPHDVDAVRVDEANVDPLGECRFPARADIRDGGKA